jgi:hypothetical protein
LRINEAINFTLDLKHPEPDYGDLYLLRGKRRKDRYVYVSPEIIGILKNND